CKKCQQRIKKHGLKDEHELQSYFIQRVQKMLEKHGKKMIGWDEILEGGLAPNAIVMSWRGEEGGIAAANSGHDVIMTPGGWCYLDHYQGSEKVEPESIGGYTTLEKSYSYQPIPKAISADKVHHVLGTQGNVWSEYLYSEEVAEHRIYPRIIALAEVGWSTAKNQNFKDFWRRMQNQFVRLDLHNINFRIPKPEGPANFVAFQDSVKLTFTTTEPTAMYYTTDGSEPNKNSQKYTEPISLKEDATLKIRTVLPMGKASAVRTIKVRKQEPTPNVTVEKTQTGLKMKLAKGNFSEVADLDRVQKWQESVMENPNQRAADLFGERETAAMILEGFLEIPETGAYRFSTTNDQLFLDGKLLISNDKELRKHSKNDAMKVLEKGLHPIRIVFLNSIRGGYPTTWGSIEVKWQMPNAEKLQQIPAEMYKH
ncbi:MAG: beta-hexosaminidase, partial [Draconibacterium sp.]